MLYCERGQIVFFLRVWLAKVAPLFPYFSSQKGHKGAVIGANRCYEGRNCPMNLPRQNEHFPAVLSIFAISFLPREASLTGCKTQSLLFESTSSFRVERPLQPTVSSLKAKPNILNFLHIFKH